MQVVPGRWVWERSGARADGRVTARIPDGEVVRRPGLAFGRHDERSATYSAAENFAYNEAIAALELVREGGRLRYKADFERFEKVSRAVEAAFSKEGAEAGRAVAQPAAEAAAADGEMSARVALLEEERDALREKVEDVERETGVVKHALELERDNAERALEAVQEELKELSEKYQMVKEQLEKED